MASRWLAWQFSQRAARPHCRNCHLSGRKRARTGKHVGTTVALGDRMDNRSRIPEELQSYRYNPERHRASRRKAPRPRANPLLDPLARYKQPLLTHRRGKAVIEFEPVDVVAIRLEFGATRRQLARIVGISVHTLRNWESGRRRPHGPARALLRAIAADPVALARALNFQRADPVIEPEDWEEN
jgi:putative transcriptional regulator